MPPRTSLNATQAPLEERILAVATDLFIRYGYKGVSFLAIASLLGISHSHIHYYFRTKSRLAEAVLDAYVAQTKADFLAIWAEDGCSLFDRFVRSRDWIWRQYIRFNPGGSGGHNWGLLAGFVADGELLTPSMRKTIRTTLEDMDRYIDAGIGRAIGDGELSTATPRHALVLQISSLLHTSRHIIRFEGSFQRLDDLFQWTYEVIRAAYSTAPPPAAVWPALTAEAAPS
ncbi:TetR/AcrR family transcriptional regulator [Rhodopila sp.]|jgi:AcrR family transcriptional regulator|uniref:TetR/AcrR family transcriptional regulator n=1 Tax=Rhodopila sp. TaxID=2480087 RepID=UPI002D16438A|nr:TetR/AcrR family transcriptional regulator [Rhodopila sp.]HVZ06722.1 TetR/AcrR family transcriptional regulator [Rhodopila sp.]